MFAISRMDVLPVGDYGLRAGVRRLYGLADLPTADELREVAGPRRPPRAVGASDVWPGRGPVPQSGEGG